MTTKYLFQLLTVLILTSCIKQQDLDIELKLNSDHFSNLDSANIEITFKNNTNKELPILIDNPMSYTGGLWYNFNFKLTSNNGENYLYCENNSTLSSVKLTSQKDHSENFDTIPPSGLLSKKYRLRKLVTPIEKNLKPGNYKLKLIHENIYSNTVHFAIKN
tara:strand:- start:51 stop:533 length:483 start_codon:yes stop_codon:yes gene_type:complete